MGLEFYILLGIGAEIGLYRYGGENWDSGLEA